MSSLRRARQARTTRADAVKRSTATLSPCALQLREHDPDRFFCTLFAPADRREALYALYAFDLELARVHRRVSEAMLGAIRFQWWRETLDGITAGTPRAHDIARALASAADHIELSRLGAVIDARERMFDAGAVTLESMERDAGDGDGGITQEALRILGCDTEAVVPTARAAGLAQGLAVMLRQAIVDAGAAGQILPRDLLERHGVDHAAAFGDDAALRMAAAVEAFAERTMAHVREVRWRSRDLPRAALPALLPVTFVARDLATLRRSGYNLTAPALAHRGGGRQLAVLLKALTGRL